MRLDSTLFIGTVKIVLTKKQWTNPRLPPVLSAGNKIGKKLKGQLGQKPVTAQVDEK
jgi:hypothetical protein